MIYLLILIIVGLLLYISDLLSNISNYKSAIKLINQENSRLYRIIKEYQDYFDKIK